MIFVLKRADGWWESAGETCESILEQKYGTPFKG